MTGWLKFLAKGMLCLLLHALCIRRVDSRQVYFVSFNGLRYACSPKYLYERLIASGGGGLRFVWEFRDIGKQALVPGATAVRSRSLKALVRMMTSGFIVANNDIPWWIPLRRKQVVVQTWHAGGAYKKVGLSLDDGRLNRMNQKLCARRITWYLSSCETFSQVQSEAKLVPRKKFLDSGLPRNDLLVHGGTDVRRSVRSAFGMADSDAGIVLYAPTFRGKAGIKEGTTMRFLLSKEGMEEVLSAAQRRFGKKFILMLRAHNYDMLLGKDIPSGAVDATDWDDMQELLCAADILITDYSSCMWDFALTGKPAFIYAPDLEHYASCERDFYTPPSEWPYGTFTDIGALCGGIEAYSPDNAKARIASHLEKMGSFEDGNAADRVLRAAGLLTEEA